MSRRAGKLSADIATVQDPVIEQLAAQASGSIEQLVLHLMLLDQQAHLLAFVDNFYLFGLMALGGIPLVFLFKRVIYTKQPAAAAH